MILRRLERRELMHWIYIILLPFSRRGNSRPIYRYGWSGRKLMRKIKVRYSKGGKPQRDPAIKQPPTSIVHRKKR
jgi:hypothetical protein